MKKKVIAIIVAAGISSRFKCKIPKPYYEINGVPILKSSIKKFLEHPLVDGVKVIINKSHINLYKKATADLNVLPFVIGGDTRQESVLNGLVDLEVVLPDKVLIHDAARPFISSRLITNVINKLNHCQAVDVACPVTDTIKQKQGEKLHILNRAELYSTQTPQGFNYELILKLHKNSKKSYTDDISLCIAENLDVKVVDGHISNRKITYIEDLNLIE